MQNQRLIFLGLGSSDAQALRWLRKAVRELKRQPELRLLAASAIYESDAQLPESASKTWPESWKNARYLNLALCCATSVHDPLRLLRMIKAIEARLGRLPRERWAPREIDIDILAFGSEVFRSPELTIPHPELLNRPFALLPLLEVAPQWTHPENPAGNDRIRQWRAEGAPFRTRRTDLSLCELMGIVNLTPDSFSDGGRYQDPVALQEKIGEHLRNGVTLLDFGAESTRPRPEATSAPLAEPLTEDEEWARLQTGLDAVAQLSPEDRAAIEISIDTRNPSVLKRALQATRIDFVNDVSGGENPELVRLVAESGAKFIFMHSLGIPPSKDRALPSHPEATLQLLDWARARAKLLVESGIPEEKLIFDPGVGFGKSPEQTFRFLGRCHELHVLRLPVLIGHSRKSFMRILTEKPAGQRDLETALISAHLASAGIEYLRIHDAPPQIQAVRTAALLNLTRFAEES